MAFLLISLKKIIKKIKRNDLMMRYHERKGKSDVNFKIMAKELDITIIMYNQSKGPS